MVIDIDALLAANGYVCEPPGVARVVVDCDHSPMDSSGGLSGRWHNRPMSRAIASLLVVVVLQSAIAVAQLDVAGEWNVTFTGPQGPADYTMYVAQEGTRLTGRMTSPSGEFPLRGTVEESRFRIVWSLPDRGRILEITFVGTIQGDRLSGTARIANAGEGPVSGERIGR
jgi:hypothetical protein